MKVFILHPPLYPVNHKLFNELGELCDLTVLSFGNHPGLHSNWLVKDFISPEQFKKYEVFGKEMGFRHVESGALVRSSYKAHKHID